MIIPLYPLRFEPFLRPMPWGGRRLADWFEHPIPANDRFGEAWLLSDHAIHNSRVAGGPLAGRTIRQLLEEHGESLLGFAVERFPLLIKLLDARENLSVQVHPDDELAKRWSPGEGGKTEAWYVLDAEPDAAIYIGLKGSIDKTTLANEMLRDTAPLCLQRHEPKPGQCYFVPAGTIHALGGGLVVLEVQQTSDATFRLYDWGRVDAKGQPRPLHLEAGLACVKEHPVNAGLQREQPLESGRSKLVECEFFSIERWEWQGERAIDGPAILVGLKGEAVVHSPNGSTLLKRGHLVLVPASLKDCRVKANSPFGIAVIRFGVGV